MDDDFQDDYYIVNSGDYASPGKWGGNVISSARALPPSGTSAIALFKDDGFGWGGGGRWAAYVGSIGYLLWPHIILC